MNTVRFIFAIHNHQPVGNFDHVLEKCFKDCYQPFLDLLAEYPSVRVALHYSGPLLQFIQKKHPYYIERLRTLAARGQVEIMGGGFYEPILSAIPQRDALGQLTKLSDWLEANLGQRPRGLWLPERVWEPHLPSLLAETGLKYTMVDDTHLRAAGIGADQITGYYMTEDAGNKLAIFPVDRKLRYLIPFRLPEETIDYLRWMAGRENGVAVTLGDDGEKFGVWPETHKWVYEEGYLRRLFAMLDQNRDWIRMTHPSECRAQTTAHGRVYLPTASYAEMMEWALPTPAREAFEDFHKEMEKRHDFAQIEPFVRGGQWRNFLTKYPESNFIHKKMLHVSRLVEEVKRQKAKAKNQNLDAAEDHLWQAQCNCAYWHGLFGGLYLSHLRNALYEHLIAAEEILRKAKNGGVTVERLDYDCDANDELLVATPQSTIGIAPSYGGSVFEYDFLPTRFNLLNILTRRREAYHRNIASAVLTAPTYGGGQPQSIHSVQRAKEAGLEQHVVNDWYDRRMFQDHIFGASATLENYSRNQFPELGDFVNQPLEILKTSQDKTSARIILRREGGLYENNQKTPLTIVKTFIAHADGSLTVQYHLSTPNGQELTVWFGSELNFTLLGSEPDNYYYDLPQEREGLGAFLDVPSADTLSAVSMPMGLSLDITFTPTAHLWAFPVMTVSQSEGGLERTYQGSSVTPHWKLKVKPEEGATVSVQLKPTKL